MSGPPSGPRGDFQQQQQQQQYTQEQYYAILQQQQASLLHNSNNSSNSLHLQAIQPQQLQGIPPQQQQQQQLQRVAGGGTGGPTSSSGRQQQQGQGPVNASSNTNGIPGSSLSKQRRDSMDGGDDSRDGNGAGLNKDGQQHKFSRSKGVSTVKSPILLTARFRWHDRATCTLSTTTEQSFSSSPSSLALDLCIPPRTAQSNFELSPPTATSVCVLTLSTSLAGLSAMQSSQATLFWRCKASVRTMSAVSSILSLFLYASTPLRFSPSALLPLPNAYAITSSLICASPTTTISRIFIVIRMLQYALQYCVIPFMRLSRSSGTSLNASFRRNPLRRKILQNNPSRRLPRSKHPSTLKQVLLFFTGRLCFVILAGAQILS